jgi:C-terminal processing protease CtpA/Prc
MSVTGLVDGQRATEEYTARDLEQLKADNPPAAALYERWAGAGGPGRVFIGGGIQIRGGGIVQFNQINQINLQPAVPDEIDQLRASLDKQMRDAKLKDADRDEVNKGLEKLTDARMNGAGIVAGMDKYSDQCDEFRKTLEQYKLDPGELLPPPAKTRLGVSISTEPAGMFIQRVGEKSRAERIGLKPGDQIKKVDGKDVTNIADLRKAASAKEKGLIIEINREGTDLKLEEKEAKAEPAK